MEEKYNEMLETFAKKQGAFLFGVADTKRMQKELGSPPFPFLDLPFAISIAVPLSFKIIESLTNSPTLLYAHHYKQLNYTLDRIALSLTHFIQKKGYNALPFPASQITDWENVKGEISHKKVAEFAGIGWIGKSSLVVTKEFGARIRLVTILTDIPLQPGGKIEGNCGGCRMCEEACPASAITSQGFLPYVCLEKLKEFKKRGIGQYICGICQKACAPKQNI